MKVLLIILGVVGLVVLGVVVAVIRFLSKPDNYR